MAYRTLPIDPARRQDRPGAEALRHPIFWGCLAVLLFNDHVLKGAGLLPGAVTGKLSDLAGLVVAPLLAVALFGARRPLARLLALAVPVVPFVALELSPSAARAVETLTATAGVPWRVWPDATDLLALAVLPLSYWLSGLRRDRAPRPWTARAGVLLGAIACVATSAPPPNGGGGTWSTDTYVLNQAGSIDLRVRWVTGELACDLVETRVAETFARDAFDEGVTFHLEQGDTIPLDRGAAATAAGFDAEIPASSSACDAVLLQVEGMPNTVAFWQRGSFQNVQPSMTTEAPGDGAVMLQRVTNDEGMPIAAVATSGIVATPMIERLEPEECLAGGAGATFSWSETAQGSGTVRISSIDRGPDGCYALSLSESIDLPSFFFVCVPAEAFPFEAGDTIEIAHLTAQDQRSLRLARAGSAGRPRVELFIYAGVSGVDTGAIVGEMVDTDCVGDRLSCGGFAVPGALHLTTDLGVDQTVVTGGSTDVDVAGGHATVMVGRVERMVLAHPECLGGRSSLGIAGDVLILTEED